LTFIDAAKSKIFDGNKSVSEIAYELGFKYPQHFTRVFKQHTGVTPQEITEEDGKFCLKTILNFLKIRWLSSQEHRADLEESLHGNSQGKVRRLSSLRVTKRSCKERQRR
jgi:AraC-like DNA-binding protein